MLFVIYLLHLCPEPSGLLELCTGLGRPMSRKKRTQIQQEELNDSNQSSKAGEMHKSRFLNPFLAVLALISTLVILTYDKILAPIWEDYQLRSYDLNKYQSSDLEAAPLLRSRPIVHTLDSKHLPEHGEHGKRSKRVAIVGDVHGCKDQLSDLLRKIDFSPKYDHLICVGDVINKGPDTAGTLRLLRSMGASSVRGNHEQELLNRLDEIASGVAVNEVDPITKLAASLEPEDIRFIRNFPHILSLGHIRGLPYANTVVVHAGLMPGVSLDQQDPKLVMNMRSIDLREAVPKIPRDKGVAWWKVWNRVQKRQKDDRHTLVVYGHDSKSGLKVKPFSVGLDSGCVKGEKLSALVIGSAKGRMSQEVVSIDCR
ncbi:hypothetical protein MRB53_037000 [Persea americana]|nr:hypothetical protein MRB53_037000 [Persea americana]